ncbi:Putative phage tail protein [Tenacibaculum finnmarkense genomovar ulcerans]|uniref:Phage tail protein n=1 Tax=Tenacibaculum finnmarkense genomovar ulcerans TaxID=2781388 RepID=A0A2I2MC44_9FLAO|nr:phage tail tape measure protein [Tenacibaculum finnmarkense]SOU89494.1 Putative phage tail protein [Tenacibaculum finnmarkense genomovar ulcerans]
MAYKKKGVWDIDIVINGKKVKNTLSGVGAEVAKLNRDLKKLTPGTEEFIKKSEELKKAREHFQAIKTEINGTVSAMDKMKTKIKGIGPMILAAFSVGAVLEFFKTIADKVNVLMKLKGVISQVTNLQGNALDKATSKVKAMSETFEADTQKMTEAAHNFAEGMEIDFVDALEKIEDGFLAGADANGEFLDKLKEYPVLLKEAGFSADEAIALMSQEVKLGIYSDKGVDAIKEATLRLREMPKATIGALNAIGLSSKTIQKELKSGSKTTFEIMQKVSKKMSKLPKQSQVVGQAIADIFGGPGEDAGYKYLSNLHAIDLTTNSLIDTTNNHVKAKKLELKANEALNNVWVKLTGVGSAMNVMYSSMKMSLASLLGTLTGVKDEADEAKDSFDEQAKKVVNLNKSLTPLITEYDNLSSKTNLSKQEQNRLKTVIQQIGGIVPTAITAFDKYGKAIGVSSDTAKEFMKNHKAMLKYRNVDVIDEETKKLAKLNSELTNINKSLAQRDKDGDIIKLSHDIRPNNVITTEIKLDGNEIAKLQARATEIEGIQIGVQASLDEHTGDYLTKFVATEVKKTKKTEEQVIARDALEKTAHKFKIKNIEASTDEQLQLEINKIRASNKEKAILNAKVAEAKTKAEEKAAEKKATLLEKQKEDELAFRDSVLLSSKTVIEKEVAAYEDRLKKAGLFGKDKNKLTELDLLIKEKLEAQHQVKVAKIETEAINDFLAKKAKSYESEKIKRQTSFNNEIASVTDLAKAKSLLSETFSNEELDKIDSIETAKNGLKRQHESLELQKQAAYFQDLINLYTTALNTGEVEGVNFADNILTEEQKEALNEKLEEVRLKLSDVNVAKSGLKGGGNEDAEDDSANSNDFDFFGMTPDQWDKSFENLDTAKGQIEAVGAVLNGLQDAWGMYNQSLEANEKKQLQTLEKSTNEKKKALKKSEEEKKKALKKQLDDGLIDKEKYNKQIQSLKEKSNKEIESLDAELEKKQAEIEYKKAKRERTSALFSIAVSTGIGIAKAAAASPLTGGLPWTALIGAMGVAQAAFVMSKPLPNKGHFVGGHTGDKALYHDGQDGVTGPVHVGEWVAPKWMNDNPRYAPTIQYLENERIKGPGYFDGGHVAPPTSSGVSDYDETDETETFEDNNSPMLLEQLTRLNNHLDNGIISYALIGDEEIQELKIRTKKINNSRENAKIQ